MRDRENRMEESRVIRRKQTVGDHFYKEKGYKLGKS